MLDDPWASIAEGTSAEIKFTIVDQDGSPVVPTTLNFWLYTKQGEKVINSRSNVSLSPVATYVDVNGICKFNLLAADNVLHNQNLRQEMHVAKFYATWSAGTKAAKFLVPFWVERDHEPTA